MLQWVCGLSAYRKEGIPMKLKKLICSCLAAAVLSSASLAPASAEAGISYTFKVPEAGYAEGKITLSGLSDGAYKLYWADGERALEGYYELGEVSVKSGSASFELGEHTAIPPLAEKLIAVSGGQKATVKNAAAVYTIPAKKRFPYKPGQKNYSFMNYSDIHIDCAEHPYYEHCELHFEKALETAAKRKADFIVTAGDNITNAEGPSKEFDRYQKILADSPYTGPVYESSGNHELRVGEPDRALYTFMNATGLDGETDSLSGKKPYYYVEEPKTGDIFIFMALEFEYSPNEGEEFTDEQLDWFEGLLKKYYGRGRNIYLLQHALIGGGYGAGDDEDNFYTVPLNPVYDSTIRFQDIIEQYPELIWMSGHTHIALKYGYNYSDMDDASCHMIHDSSVCCPTMLDYDNHKLSYQAAQGEEYRDCTEGYYVEAYDDEIIYYGENLYHDKIYPSATYIMEGCRKDAGGSAPEEKSGAVQSDAAAMATLAELTFTAPKALTGENGSEADLKSLIARSRDLLDRYYTLSSFNAYAGLKRAVAESEKAGVKAAFKKLSRAYREFLPYTRSGRISVYFTDTAGWGKAYAELSSLAQEGVKLPMTFVEKDPEGADVYKIILNCREFNTAVFSDGGDENISETQHLTTENNQLFWLNNKDPLAPFTCFARKYEANQE